MKLDIPERIFGSEYSIQIHSNTLYLVFREVTHMKQILTQNITGSLAKGKNTVRNVEGVIVIEN